MTKLIDANSRNVGLKRTNLSQATLFGVFAPDANFDKEMVLYGLNGRPGQGVYVTTNKVIPSLASGKEKFDYGETAGMDLMFPDNDGTPEVFRERSMRIAAYYRSILPSTGLWGERGNATLTFGTGYASSNVNNTSTFPLNSSENRTFTGYIPEFIAYNRLLEPLERGRIDSYLAVKYGISLDVSYYGSDGSLLWDNASDPGYNHRVTAIYRDDTSGLYQTESATSYEEAPLYSATHDYYYGGNPYYRPSANRLMVLGREFANPVADRGYLFWGDDGQAFSTVQVDGKAGYKIMERSWKVKTNMPGSAEADRYMDWTTNGLAMTADGFVYKVVKSPASSSPEFGTAVSSLPLLGKEGYLDMDAFSVIGDLYIKFGANQAGYEDASDYGYYITGSKVYPVIKGVRSAEPVSTLIMPTRIEAVKEAGCMYLRVSDITLAETRIGIAPEDRDGTFYAAFALQRRLVDDNSLVLRYGGFTDTGNRIELFYDSSRAVDFKDNTAGRSFLLIDRTGRGEFGDLGAVEMVEVSEISTQRQKAIFHNVFLHDGDVFTFMHRTSDVAGEVTLVDPTCGQSDGSVTLELSSGQRAFNYTLTNTMTGTVVRTGIEYSYTIHIGGLPGGSYELYVEEDGGYSFQSGGSGGSLVRAKTTNFLPVVEGSLQWSVSNTSDSYMVGYTTIAEDVTNAKNIIHYGLAKQGNALYKVENGKLVATGVTVEVGDVLRITKVMSKTTYYKNGAEIGSTSIKWYDYLLKFYGLIDMSEGAAELLNVKAEGFFNLADYNWTRTDRMGVKSSSGSSMKYAFTIVDPCAPTYSSVLTDIEETPSQENRLAAYTDGYSLEATLELEKADVVTFAVYSTTGVLVAKQSVMQPASRHGFRYTMPDKGIYILKAITTDKEYTQKVVIK